MNSNFSNLYNIRCMWTSNSTSTLAGWIPVNFIISIKDIMNQFLFYSEQNQLCLLLMKIIIATYSRYVFFYYMYITLFWLQTMSTISFRLVCMKKTFHFSNKIIPPYYYFPKFYGHHDTSPVSFQHLSL
jgi:hypothetical protein